MSLRQRWWRRRVEAEFVRGVGGLFDARAARERLLDRMRRDPGARHVHDRLHAPLVALRDDGVSVYELEQVERWLAQDLGLHGPNEAPARTSRRAFVVLGLVAATMLIAGSIWRGFTRGAAAPTLFAQATSGLMAKGSGDGTLAIEAFCGPRLHFARPDGCGLDEELTFAFRLDPDPETMKALDALDPGTMQLALFGVLPDGAVTYYAPTPAGESALGTERTAAWQEVGFGVRLDVNHLPGKTRIFALWTPATVLPSDVENWGDRLAAERGAAGEEQIAWPVRAGLAGSRWCPRERACASAELVVELHERREH